MTSDHLLQTQNDLCAYLGLDPELADVAIIPQRSAPGEEGGSVHDVIEDALAGLKQKNGKAGLVVIVLMPDVAPQDENLPGPQMEMTCTVRVVENRIVNESASGTGLSAPLVALHLARVLHHWCPDGTHVLRPASKFIEDVSVPEREAHEVRFLLRLPLAPLARVSRPLITGEPDGGGVRITLSCATSGAAIHYSLDGSFPVAGTLYDEPFTLTAPARLRVIATAAGKLPSSVAEAEIGVPDEE